MGATYRAVMLQRKGGLDALERVELPVRRPGPGEVRLRVTVCGVGGTDLVMRTGYYPYAPPLPFVPGYEVVGVVEELGDGGATPRVGQRVAALTVTGGYAEQLVLPAAELVPVPDGLPDDAVCAVILNYVTAYQAAHRAGQVARGQTALVLGASGGVGTALLEVLREAGVTAIGAASTAKHELVRSLGATPVDGRGDVAAAVRALHPGGVDVAFDPLGGGYTGACRRALRRGGRLVALGFTSTVVPGGGTRLLALLGGVAQLYALSPLTGRRTTFYGITRDYRKDPRPFREDLQQVLALLAAGRIAPRIDAQLPLDEAREAQALLERGAVRGKVLLLPQQ
ncbi:MAG: zinc-binding dehydrogenase [Myxococcota bacterium]